ncbi:MAG: cell division protein FtsZ, partial [Deltaproteobacteria bacterium]|nr:cell division protein FtsZ [Deltaproteobacteria bacterium]
EEIAKEAIPQISVMGIGGAGCNIVTWIKEKGITGAKIFALNSDAQHLSITKADERILIGYKVTGGLGCGGFPEQGAKAAEESIEEIRNAMTGSGLVFITAGLGGGTGTGASPIVARVAKELGALTLGVVTIPFQVERARLIKAKEGLKRLVEECDAVIVIDNNRLRKVAGSLPLREAFAVANELIATFIKNISETIAVPSLMNLDFADLRAIMMGSGICAIGVGEGSGDNKVEDAVEQALNTQLLDIGDIKKAEGALVHIEGGDDMTLEDVNLAGEIVISRISDNAKVSWGARVNSTMTGSIRATVVLAGVESPFLVEEPKPFGAIKEEVGKGVEVEVVERSSSSSEEERERSLLKKIFG